MDPSESCCDPVSDGELSVMASEELAGTFKVLADPVRLRLLSLIAAVPEGEVCACDLNQPLDRSQATVSHHLSVLVRAGLISREQRGRWAWFSVSPDRGEFVRSVLAGRPSDPDGLTTAATAPALAGFVPVGTAEP